MSRAGALAVAMLGLLAAAPAVSQTPPHRLPTDAIDALLTPRPPTRDIDPEEPDTAAAGTTAGAPEPPAAPVPRDAPRQPSLTSPVRIEETGRNPDAPPTSADVAYDSRIRASMASAQGFQGPMDGGWTLLAGAHELYALQLIDRDGAVQGAWRDLRRPGALDASGFIDQVERAGSDLTFRFAAGSNLILHAAGDGRWSGALSEGGKTETVRLQRRNP